ncbi:MAG: 4Fe-4S dicluster domain-containing protein [Candidatus Bathyarchaeia archaeon]
MYKAYIDPNKCIRCPTCGAARACPPKAIFRIDTNDPNVVEVALCHGCGDCTSKCPGNAIELKKST